MRTFPAKNGGQDALQKLREENGELKKQIASLEGDNEILRNMNKILKESLDACYGVRIGPQEPLGEEFQRVLDDNRDKLYEDGVLRGEEVKDE
ncbi:MAG: hypothetical protein KKD77_24335 [Gammaproteobacteria bacterium]|nr:hypothetical protein [Gammaproteobacteria bacterium]